MIKTTKVKGIQFFMDGVIILINIDERIRQSDRKNIFRPSRKAAGGRIASGMAMMLCLCMLLAGCQAQAPGSDSKNTNVARETTVKSAASGTGQKDSGSQAGGNSRSEATAPIDTAAADNGMTDQPENTEAALKPQASGILKNPAGMTIETRFPAPEGYQRVSVTGGSFAEYLRKLPLEPDGSKVHYFDGREKEYGDYEAVIKMDIGDKDQQQCADAIMRLRGEYFFANKRYSDIHFKFVSGFNAQYTKWMEGYRISVKGNTASYVKRTGASNTYKDFRNFMDIVFAYASTLSLEKELKPGIALQDIQVGDVFIRGGSPGHAMIVVDVAKNSEGKKIFMLAQSFMPAQSIHIVSNTDANNNHGSNVPQPWYCASFSGDMLETPGWTFQRSDLRRFQN